MTAAKIEIRGLSKIFPPRVPGGETLHVIRNLNLSIVPHEFVCILGRSGCGKSTLLNAIAGLDRDYRGSIAIDGKEIEGGKPPVRIAYLFQEPRLLPWLTAEKNVDFVLRSCRVPAAEWRARKDRYFAMTGLDRFRAYYPHQLSGGMAQRLALVRGLCTEPDILLMDEPFSGLDELTARRLRVDLLSIWRETRKTVIFVTHNAFEATFLADRILIMVAGEFRAEIPVRITRPRDYDDPGIFDINRSVVRQFLQLAGTGDAVPSEPTPRAVPNEPGGPRRAGAA
jgi:ABC-type nitrate/sulfonate/bicarbonate transport system ATPase subunit